MYGALHPKSDVDRVYIKREEGGRGLMSVERRVREEENRLGFYVANSEEDLIGGITAAETINTKDTVKNAKFKKEKAQELKQNWRKNKIHGQFVSEIPQKADRDKTWQSLYQSDLKIGTEALCAAQEQAIRTTYIKHHIHKTSESPCADYVKKSENVQHLVSRCEKLAQKIFKRQLTM